jgi:hypothetical protein
MKADNLRAAIPLAPSNRLKAHKDFYRSERCILDQEDLGACVFDQRLEKFDEPVGVENVVDDHPTRLALLVMVEIIDNFWRLPGA